MAGSPNSCPSHGIRISEVPRSLRRIEFRPRANILRYFLERGVSLNSSNKRLGMDPIKGHSASKQIGRTEWARAVVLTNLFSTLVRIEETWRLWQKFLDDYSRFEDWLKSAERTAACPNSSGVLYTNAKEELKRFEVSLFRPHLPLPAKIVAPQKLLHGFGWPEAPNTAAALSLPPAAKSALMEMSLCARAVPASQAWDIVLCCSCCPAISHAKQATWGLAKRGPNPSPLHH